MNWRLEIPSIKVNWLAGLHIHENGDETRAYLVLCKKSRSMIIKAECRLYTTLIEAIAYIHKKDVRRVCLSVTGKGIISRVFPINPENIQEAFHEISGSVDSTDFWQHQRQVKQSYVLSIARSQRISPILQTLKSNGLEAVHVSLDFFQAWLFDEKTVTIQTPDYEIHENGRSNVHLQPIEQPSVHDFMGLSLDGRCLVALAGVIDYLVSGTASGAYFNAFSSERKKKTETQRANKLAAIAVSLILVILLVDSIIFKLIWIDYQENQLALEEHQAELSIIESLKSDIKSKQDLFDAFGTRKSGLASLSDQIAATIPPGVTLSVLDIHPIEGRVRKGEAPNFNREQVMIEGICVNKLVFNQWADDLAQIEGLTNITILHFSENQANASFSISISRQ